VVLIPPPTRLAVRQPRAVALVGCGRIHLPRRVGRRLGRIGLDKADLVEILVLGQHRRKGLLDGAGILGCQGVLGRKTAVRPTQECLLIRESGDLTL
jgi:hypothetical protein